MCRSHTNTGEVHEETGNHHRRARAGETVTVICQQPGQTVGGNPYWVLVSTTNGNHMGFMASYYIKNTTNWIDGVGRCQ